MSGRPKRDARINLAALALLLGIALIAYRLIDLQVVQAGRYRQIAEDQRYEQTDINPVRGSILDRDGQVLAISQEAWSICATPYLVEDKPGAAAELSGILHEPRQDIEEKLRTKSGFVYIERKVTPEVADAVRGLGIQGIALQKESKRSYPQGALGSQVLGFVGTDNTGLAGLELQYESTLAGQQGEATMEMDPSGEPIPGVTRIIKQPVDGSDVKLTLDSDIQFKLQEQLQKSLKESGAQNATGMVMDCRTGAILAMGSYPDFDVNLYSKVSADMTRNRAITDAFEPGSVLKILTSMAALNEGVVRPTSVINVPASLKIGQYEFKDDHPMPADDLTFSQVIAYSSNIGTIKTAQTMGKDALSKYQQAAGLGKLTGVDFPGENPGTVLKPEKWTATSLPTMAIGQGISVSTLQLAVLTAIVANGGIRVTPHFLDEIDNPDGSRQEYQAPEGERVISEETAASLRGILGEVVRTGTGTKAAMSLYNCAGKTGTAMKPDPAGGYREAYVATFAGLAPTEDPRLVTVITLDEPTSIYYGGLAAAPCFSQVMEFALQHLQVTPSIDHVNTKEKVVPE